MYRLPSTGTARATLRVYIGLSELDPERQGEDARTALTGLAAVAEEFAGICARTSRAEPDVVT